VSKLTYFCDLAEPTTPFPHFWEHTVGSDHARMALRADWQQQLKRAHDELGFRHVRFHDLLSDDLGTVVRDDNELHYSFFNDRNETVRRVELYAGGSCFRHENRFQLSSERHAAERLQGMGAINRAFGFSLGATLR
jgi:hypothetical protein